MLHSSGHSETAVTPRDTIKGTRYTTTISVLGRHPYALGHVIAPEWHCSFLAWYSLCSCAARSYLRPVNGHSTLALAHFIYSRFLKRTRSIILAQGRAVVQIHLTERCVKTLRWGSLLSLWWTTWHWDGVFSRHSGFPLSVSFHHCSILIHPSTTDAI
jgi:hypothetical protein